MDRWESNDRVYPIIKLFYSSGCVNWIDLSALYFYWKQCIIYHHFRFICLQAFIFNLKRKEVKSLINHSC